VAIRIIVEFIEKKKLKKTKHNQIGILWESICRNELCKFYLFICILRKYWLVTL